MVPRAGSRSPAGLPGPRDARRAGRTECTPPGEFCPHPGGDREPRPGARCGRCGGRFPAANPEAGETHRAPPQNPPPHRATPSPLCSAGTGTPTASTSSWSACWPTSIAEIIAAGRPSAKPRRRAEPIAANDELRAVLRVLQAAEAPLPPREVASRLGVPPKTASRHLSRAVHLGYVERAGQARYRVADAVPSL